MENTGHLEYNPDYAVAPGETLLETLESLGMSQAELAKRTGRPEKTINEIVKGKAAIMPDTALQLEMVLGVPARFWSNLERNYRETLAKIEERRRLEEQLAWLDGVPVRALADAGFVEESSDKPTVLARVLQFFGVASPEAWNEVWARPQAAFRGSPAFAREPGSVAAWLRIGELYAQNLRCQAYNKLAFRSSLERIRELTTKPPEVFQERLTDLCAETGVVVVFYPELPKTRLCGATRWLSPDKALIQLSLRYKTDDQLWFTFFHEAGHILLHGKRDIFLHEEKRGRCELVGDASDAAKDREADAFAQDFLIPPTDMQRFLRAGRRDKASISEFAREIGIAPGIVVGRLQHDGKLPPSHCNDLKERFELVVRN